MLINDKNSLRKLYSSIRNGIDSVFRDEADRRMVSYLINSVYFKESRNILVYISYRSEVNTDYLIDYCLKVNKSVFVPLWNNSRMDFYRIKSKNDLSDNINGIPVPDISKCEKYINSSESLCIVPGLSFDKSGNRLGYGGGYYDRFLNENKVESVALCYERCFCNNILPTEKHDIPIKIIITENSVKRGDYING